MILKCPNCGDQYEVQAKGSLDGFTMTCPSCGTDISTADEIKISPVVNKGGDVYVNKKSNFGCFWKFFIVIAVLLGIMATTVPDKEKHFNKLSSFVAEKSKRDNPGVSVLEHAMNVGFANFAIGLGLEVDDYFFFNVGKIKVGGIHKTISIGFLNHVFVLSGIDSEVDTSY